MENYKLTNHNSIIRQSDNACIPFAEGNTDYAQYQQWLADGNTPIPADPLPLPDYTALRLNDYRNESDPLFFKWQRGEVTQEEWLAKVAEIKARSYDNVSN